MLLLTSPTCQKGEKKERDCMSVHASYISFYYDLRRRTMTSNDKKKNEGKRKEEREICLFASIFSDFSYLSLYSLKARVYCV
jgi:hypothetical protein